MNVATSIEQSKKLVEIGIDSCTAGMCWTLREPSVPSKVMIPIDLAIKLYKQNLI